MMRLRALIPILICTSFFVRASFASAGLIKYCGEVGTRLGVTTRCVSSCGSGEMDVATMRSFVPSDYQFVMDSLCDAGSVCCAQRGDTLCSKATALVSLQGGTCSSACATGMKDLTSALSSAPALCTDGSVCCVQSGQGAQVTGVSGSSLQGVKKGTSVSTISKAAGTPGYNLINPLGSRSVPTLASDFIKWISGIAGSVFILYLLWGGLEWMMAGGDPKKATAARNRILYAVLGVTVIFLAYFLVDALIGITNIPF